MTDNITEGMSDIVGKAKDFMESDDFKKISPYLMSGGGGALLGAILTSKRRKDRDEGRLSHLGRVLGNATLMGAGAAGAHAALGTAYDNTMGAVDSDKISTGGASDEGPLGSTIKNLAFNPLVAGASGALALGLTDGNAVFGAGREASGKALQGVVDTLNLGRGKGSKITAEMLQNLSPAEVAKIRGISFDARRSAGLASEYSIFLAPGSRAAKIKGLLSKLTRTGIGSTFGQTATRRMGRGALGLAAMGIPALAGAFLTDSED